MHLCAFGFFLASLRVVSNAHGLSCVLAAEYGEGPGHGGAGGDQGQGGAD